MTTKTKDYNPYMTLWNEAQTFRQSDNPADRKFYVDVLDGLIEIARVFWKVSDKSERSKIEGLAKELKKHKQNYKIYPKL